MRFIRIRIGSGLWMFCALLFLSELQAQQTIVLPHNGSVTQETCLQGGLRYQRQLYLITPDELAMTGLQNGMAIDAIGFTIGAAQDTSASGILKVYLQNTTDTESRLDTNWTTVTTMTNSYTIDPLARGDYEWQVRAVCSDSSVYSALAAFSNTDLSGCNQPEDLSTTNITSASAIFQWQSVESPSFSHYFIQYTRIDSVNWISDTTSSSSYNATGLTPGKSYQWNVQAICSGGNSPISGSSFQTDVIIACSSPSNPTTGTITNTTAVLNWTDDPTANRYDIQYRRLLTEFWYSTISFTNTVQINGLTAGTDYEWRVRTVCDDGVGAYVEGPDFLTTGTFMCYPPTGLHEDNLTDSTVTLQWIAPSGATSYVLRYRLKNAISWTNAFTPMTLVHHDTTEMPASAGAFNIPFSGSGINPFTYTGNGLYIAWEYSNDSSAVSSFNTSLATTEGTVITDIYGLDSVEVVLCLSAFDEDVLPNTLLSNRTRPETRLGSPSLKDSVEVVVVYTTGYQAVPNGNPAGISAVIRNYSPATTEYPVTLTIKDVLSGTVRFTETVDVEVEGDSSAMAVFSDWTPSILETDSVIVSVPAQTQENVLTNNSFAYLQDVNPILLSYSDDSGPVTAAGFGTGEGLILVKHIVQGCTKINGAKIFLHTSAKDHDVYAVVLDADGAVLATSATFSPDSTETGRWHSFYFSSPPVISDDPFYIGLAQTADVMEGYHPVGIQWETTMVRDSAYYRAALDGTGLTHQPQPGRPMIRAELLPGYATPVIDGDLSLCAGDTNTLSLASLDLRYASSVIGFSTQFSPTQYSAMQVLGPPDVFPAYGGHPQAWTSSTFDGQDEYLHLGYQDPAPVNRIVIYETYNPGAVDSVFVKDPGTGNFVLVYSDAAQSLPPVARALTIDFPLTAFNVSEIRISINSVDVPGFNTIDAVAIGHYDTSPDYPTILWSPNGETTNSIEVTTTGTYGVSVTDPAGCTGSAEAEVYTPDSTSPVITADGPVSFCEGGSVTLSSDQETGNTWNTGETTQSIGVNSTGAYFLTYDDGTGCGLLQSNTINVAVNTLPIVTISGTLYICPGSSTQLNAGVYTSYAWSTGAMTQMITVSSTGVYSVTVTDANGCSGSSSVNVTEAPELTPEITGDLTFCAGSSTILDAGSYANYDWSTGASTQTISVNTGGNYSVTVEDVNGCSGSASVTVNSLVTPIPIITGTGGFCPGGQTMLHAGAGYVSYAWSHGPITETVTINSPGTYTVTVTDNNGCTGTDNQVVVEFTPPDPFISGTFSFCAGSNTQLDAGPGYQSYLWSTGEVSQTIVVDTVDTFDVTVTDNNGCTGTASATTTMEGAIPVSPDPITGPTSGLCGETGIEYSIPPVANAAFYVWTVPPGVTIVSGQGTTTIIVDFSGSFTSGDIVVAASNACGQSPSIDPTFVTVYGTPAIPASITGPLTNVCPGDEFVYSTGAVPTATSYNWTVPANANITSGQGSTSVTVAFLNGFTEGDICVSAVNACGSSDPRCIFIFEGDLDGDGILDCEDNCPENYNPNQKDRDHDGIGDACDPCNNNQQGGSCDDGDPCTVNDMLDPNCVCVGTFQDSDGDGVCDAFDICPGFDDNVDTDGDSVPDGCDACPGFDDLLDDNNNGIPDSCENCVPLLVNAGTCQVVYYGYAPAQCTTLTANTTNGTGPYTYDWSTGGATQAINVCPTTNTVYMVTVTDANGCTGTDEVTVEAVDVRCGPNNANVELCHYDANTNTYTTLCVKQNKVQMHLNHGDVLGECGLTPCNGNYQMQIPAGHDDDDDVLSEERPETIPAVWNSDNPGTLEIFPNPANGKVMCKLVTESGQEIRWRLVDLHGRILYATTRIPAGQKTEMILDVSGIDPGLYFIQIHDGTTMHQRKLVIAK